MKPVVDRSRLGACWQAANLSPAVPGVAGATGSAGRRAGRRGAWPQADARLRQRTIRPAAAPRP